MIGPTSSMAETKGGHPMNDKPVYRGYRWERHVALRVFLAMASLVSMVLASGASSHWMW